MSDITITTIEVAPRKCGVRQQGGFYLIGDMSSETSVFFPKALECGCGMEVMRPSRSIQKFKPGKMWPSLRIEGPANRLRITFKEDDLAWAVTIDKKNYKMPSDYFDEADKQGISRRMNNGPLKQFKLGESWAFIIHDRAIPLGELNTDDIEIDEKTGKKEMYKAGFIGCFKPTAIQYVVIGDEKESYLQELIKKA
jgi:hypothetical protein